MIHAYKIDTVLDWFVNAKDKENPETLRKGRFFVASLLLLIVLGLPILVYFMLFQGLLVKNTLTIVSMYLLTSFVLVLYKKNTKRILLVNVLTAIFFSLQYTTYEIGGLFSVFNLRCLIFACWAFLVASKRSGIFWFGVTLVYYVFLYYADQSGMKNFKADVLQADSSVTFLNNIFFSSFLGIIIYLYEIGKEKYLNALMVAKANIEHQNKELEMQKHDIVSSIKYASRIQHAILPPDDVINTYLPHSFILYKPRNIVSGDFYFVKQVDEYLFVAAADCTGHGVPGSLMTILGTTVLNELVVIHRLTDSNLILDELRNKVKLSLQQTGKQSETKDGMDIALCVINSKLRKMQFSGANNGLIQINNGNITEHKADKMPISIYPLERPFTKTEITYNNDDTFYLYSDGYSDQFGGANEQKFKKKQFNDLLLAVSSHPLAEQKRIIETAHQQWMGSLHEQTDDILVIGFKI